MHKHILYMAAGSSRRFGANKLLHPIAGKPMAFYGLETLQQVTAARSDRTVTVVSRYGEIRAAAQGFGFTAIDSPQSELGVSHTIRAGIAALGEVSPEDYLLFMVADQPYLTAASVEKLLALAEEGPECASLCFGERPGNPALFSARLLPELLALQGDKGGRAVLKRHDCVFVQAASLRELEDIDTQ